MAAFKGSPDASNMSGVSSLPVAMSSIFLPLIPLFLLPPNCIISCWPAYNLRVFLALFQAVSWLHWLVSHLAVMQDAG